MFCEKCGKELKAGDAFCWFCGTPVPEAGDVEGAVEKELSESVAAMKTDDQSGPQTSETQMKVSQTSETLTSNSQSTGAQKSDANRTPVDEGTQYHNAKRVSNNKMELDSKVLIGEVSSKFNNNRETNSVATSLKIIGWLVIGFRIVAGLIIIFYAMSKTGSSSSSYNPISSAVTGASAGLGIGVIVASLIPGIGFLGFAEIIQLLQDQKTILLRQNRK